MSNTKRRDHYVDANGKPLFDEDKPWKVLGDRKKWYKPSKKAKEGDLMKVRVGRRRDLNKAMLHPDDDGDVILPVEKKTDVWYYN
jgi:hypothetical protein